MEMEHIFPGLRRGRVTAAPLLSLEGEESEDINDLQQHVTPSHKFLEILFS